MPLIRIQQKLFWEPEERPEKKLSQNRVEKKVTGLLCSHVENSMERKGLLCSHLERLYVPGKRLHHFEQVNLQRATEICENFPSEDLWHFLRGANFTIKSDVLQLHSREVNK